MFRARNLTALSIFLQQPERILLCLSSLLIWMAIPQLALGHGPANPPMIRGLPESALERIPGAPQVSSMSPMPRRHHASSQDGRSSPEKSSPDSSWT